MSKKGSSGMGSTRSQVLALIYFALTAYLVLVFVGQLAGFSELLFGPLFGKAYGRGMFYLFGSVMSFLFPVVTAYIGYRQLHNETPSTRALLLLLALLVVGSTLLAIHDMDKLVTHSYIPESNVIGHAGAYLFTAGFAAAQFGPYFITTLLLAIVLVALFRADLRDLYHTILQFFEGHSISLPKILRKSNKSVQESLPQTDDNPNKTTHTITDTMHHQESTTEENSQNSTIEHPPIAITGYDETVLPQDDVEEASDDSPIENSETFQDSSEASPLIVTPSEEVLSDSDDDEIDEADISDASLAAPSLLVDNGKTVVPESSVGVVAEVEEEHVVQKPYEIPSIDVIPDPPAAKQEVDVEWINTKSMELIRTLDEFRLKGCKVSRVNPGPVVTQFEIQLAPGIQVKKIINLQDDIALKVGGKAIRIEAPIPGKAAVGIEIPNDTREIVYYKDILRSPAFQNSKAKLPVIIGKSIAGVPIVEDIAKMPHLLIAGQTGAGKSVGINSFIATLLLTKSPDELRMIMIDPKKVEMACYEGIPHLMSPVVTEPDKAVAALQWAVREMESRYRLLAKVGSKNLESFNKRFEEGKLQKFVDNESITENENKKLPYVVIVIDELADLMMTAAKDVEALVQRIAQLARAVGIHLIVATQRPSVDIITGPIKANLTSRISFRTIQQQDSRTILGAIGAEKLLGMGDMLYLKNGAPTISRYHGAFISEEDVENLVETIKEQGVELNKIQFQVTESTDNSSRGGVKQGGGNYDELFEDAARIIVSTGIASVTGIQRRLSIGFSRAGRIMDQLEDAGVVGPNVGSKAREILITAETLEDMFD